MCVEIWNCMAFKLPEEQIKKLDNKEVVGAIELFINTLPEGCRKALEKLIKEEAQNEEA